MVLPWLSISYSTGNHLERVRMVFDFIDANGNNALEYSELNLALKDKNFVFFSSYSRTDDELIQALLADQNSGCLPQVLSTLQSTCAIGASAPCLQSSSWDAEGGNLLRSPVKLQRCVAVGTA
jgi:hypothetical protein